MANPISPKPTADEGVEMSEILRPCPFCGESVELDYSELPNRKHWFITCECCGMMYQSSISQRKYVKVDWNNRPIEDALNKRIAELEAEIERLTVHSDTERQDDNYSNHTQTQTVVYRKESEE